jgi:hypothetical protein
MPQRGEIWRYLLLEHGDYRVARYLGNNIYDMWHFFNSEFYKIKIDSNNIDLWKRIA